MLMPLSAKVANMVLAIPGWLRIAMPTTEILHTFSDVKISSIPTSVLMPSKTDWARSNSDPPTEKVISVLPSVLAAVWTIISTLTL